MSSVAVPTYSATLDTTGAPSLFCACSPSVSLSLGGRTSIDYLTSLSSAHKYDAILFSAHLTVVARRLACALVLGTIPSFASISIVRP